MQMYLAKRNSSDSLTTGTVFLEYKTLIVQNSSSLFLGKFCQCPHPPPNVTGSFYESLFLEILKQANTSASSFSLARGLTTTQNYNSCPMSRVTRTSAQQPNIYLSLLYNRLCLKFISFEAKEIACVSSMYYCWGIRSKVIASGLKAS